jgi:hypothetical protein
MRPARAFCRCGFPRLEWPGRYRWACVHGHGLEPPPGPYVVSRRPAGGAEARPLRATCGGCGAPAGDLDGGRCGACMVADGLPPALGATRRRLAVAAIAESLAGRSLATWLRGREGRGAGPVPRALVASLAAERAP